jgi:hypothetical protein
MKIRMQRLLLPAVLTGVVLLAVIFIRFPICFKDFSFSDFTQLVGKLLLIAVFLERSLDVFLTTFRAHGSEELQREIRRIKTDLSKFIEKNGNVSAAKRVSYDGKLEIERQKLAAFKSKTRIIALWSGFTVGIILGCIGVRSLDCLLDKEVFSGLPVFQQKAFQFIDILLTGGVLAGGSDSIHKIFDVYTTYMHTSSSKAAGTQDNE